MSGLRFNESLSWRAGNPIAIADLLRRLQALAKELRDLEQEDIPREAFAKVAKELVSPNLLAHKDKGVKAFVACCLVDILRLCAPDAPYTEQQLKDIFNLLISTILPSLADPSHAYNNQHLYVLNSLATVKSIVLLTDLPSSEALTINLFVTFFDTLSGSSKASSGEQLGKTVEFNMTAVLVTMVDEATTLPLEVTDIIVAQFLRADPRALGGLGLKARKNGLVPSERQTTLTLRDLPPAYNMAKTICNSCPEKMAQQISQYFNEVIVDASTSAPKKTTRRNSVDDSDEENAGGANTEEDMKELRKAHQLLRELWRASPAVLQNVIPQLEAELSAENVQLRLLATETLGDIVSGIGAAGLPPTPPMDPASYPPVSLDSSAETINENLLTKPSSPQPFPQAHPHAYSTFLSRKHDKSPIIRAAWTTGIGRILATSAGGVGLGREEEERLVSDLARMMSDADEKVRVAAVKVVSRLSFRDIVSKLGSLGGVADAGSVLATLAERCRDRKHIVRMEAMKVLGRLWGIASGEIMAGNSTVTTILGAIPTKILDTSYANDLEINVLLEHVLYEQLLPLSYPPIKVKSSKPANGDSQKLNGSQTAGEVDQQSVDVDKIRTERLLTLVKGLDEKAKKAFFAYPFHQTQHSKVMSAFLTRCEDYNGGVMDANESKIKDNMRRLIEHFAQLLPDRAKVVNDLWKFAKTHDRRNYQLIRFCMAPESDYRTMFKAFKELTKRIETATNAPRDLLDTLLPLVYKSSIILYNKSHVPAIMEYARTDENGLASTAHEVLRELSSRTPEVLKAHVQEICKMLQDEEPSAKKANDPGAVDNLKACSSFASRFAKEIPQDRKFIQALTGFALYGTPPEAAKYAVHIMMTVSDKKELLAKQLVEKCVKGFQYGGPGFLARLATISQLMLLAPNEVEEESDAVIDIAIKDILLKVRSPSTESSEAYAWSDTTDIECAAKCWALKILVNRIRSYESTETLAEIAAPVYNLLATLIAKHGELASSKNTPPTHRSRLRLLAARLYLKLCLKKSHDALLAPAAFNDLALVAQDAETAVRVSFLQRLKKYLGRNRLPQRFYTIPFLLAFEPNTALKSDTTTWIRSRAAYFASMPSHPSGSGTKPNIVLESVFARLLSLLAHHPDYNSDAEDLIDFTRYLLFYLQNVANEEKLSLIYHIAQRVKQFHDAVWNLDENLYTLSDLAQLTIRKWEEAHGWSVQTLPAKVRLPTSIFAEVKDHAEAVEVAEKNFLPAGVEEGVENLVRRSLRKERPHGSKKRKSEADGEGAGGGDKKKAKLPIRKASTTTGEAAKKRKPAATAKTPKPKKPTAEKDSSEIGSGERRRSGRVSNNAAVYTERDDEEDDEEMDEGVAAWVHEDEDGNPIAAEPEPSEDNADIESVAEDTEAGGKEDMELDELNREEDEEEEEEEPSTPAKPSPRGKGRPKASLKKTKNPPPPASSSPKAAKTNRKKAPPAKRATRASRGI